ncbi:hypothetical protein Pan189_09450 [Stratiformator vulcanicus]|uniref:DUF1552 domain-containing protein n=2 Tax=Stratiformator vulcanicus TaxID=2527980 RepID=A0A517QY74_9PLAN|nr:hypothetical protein Pan189_09450 [Stratiformator vulcanicus]
MLRGTGVAVALPWLESMSSMSRSVVNAGEIAEHERPRRSVFSMWGLGLNGRDFTPTQTGKNWEETTILKPLSHLRDDFTIVSGLKLTHSGGHGGDRTFLTGTSTHDAGSELRISCDQELAEVVGNDTRFRSLVLGINRGTSFGNPQDNTLSWTRSGTPIPAENRPDVIFDRLFRSENAEQIAARKAGSARTASVLDAVRDEATRLNNRLGQADQRKLDQYFTSIRDLEHSMAEDLAWLDRPKPEVEPVDFGEDLQALDPQRQKKSTFDYRRYQRLMYDVITLAFQTDSTRVISYMARKDLRDGTYAYGTMGCPYGYHEMTHHGEDPDKLRWLTKVDTWYSEEWAYFIEKLKGVPEGSGSLLDHTMLVWGSSGGTRNAHNRTWLPTMLVGGHKLGVRHQGHIIKEDDYFGNLWQTMFGFMGAPIPQDFQGGEADGVIRELV